MKTTQIKGKPDVMQALVRLGFRSNMNFTIIDGFIRKNFNH